MLKSIDQALAGAIDVIADDVQATVKSVREQGMMRTLGDAVEDAGKLVASGAGNAFSGMLGGKKGEKTVSTHSGMSSGYADICAGNKAGSFGSGGAAFPYVPNGGSSRPGATTTKAPVGNFGPGIGIRLPNQAPNAQAPPGILPYAGGGGAAGAGAFRPPPFQPPAAAAAPAAPAPTPYTPYTTPGPAVPASAGKEATIPTELLKPRFDAIVGKDPANARCFDCGVNDHEWASVSFGIFLCITCAGHHRQLGTHISRIRSIKMDSWTEKQLQIFNSGGNRRMAEFFQANGVPASSMYQRYSTPAGEWYREAWIKSRTMGRPVPAPPQGVVAGPCIDNQAPQAAKAPAAPAVDLLDVGAEAEKPKASKAAPAQTADLLNFDGPAVSNSKETDLLGGGAGAGDLLGLSGGTANQANDLLSLGAGGRVPLDFSAGPQAPSITAQSVTVPSILPSSTPAMEVPAPAPAAAAQPQPSRPTAGPHGSNTLGGGAKLVEQPQEKADDPFALALKQWNM